MWLGVVVDVDDVDHEMLGSIDPALHRFTSALKSNPWISGATGTLSKFFLKLDLSISRNRW